MEMVWTRVVPAQMKKHKGQDKKPVQVQPAGFTDAAANGGKEGYEEAGFQV